MAWFSRFTRFGDMHWVYGQERGMSCGLACVTMLVFKVNKLIPGKASVKTEQDINKVFDKVAGRVYDPSAGTYPEELVKVLNQLAVGKWTNEYLTGSAVSAKIIEKVGVWPAPGPTVNVNPVIVGIDWDSGGAHWVCIDTVRSMLGSNYATVCDPWDANVHVTRIDAGKAFAYQAKQVVGSWDMRSVAEKVVGSSYGPSLDRVLGKKAFQYDAAPAPGESKQWGIIYRV